MSASAHSGDGIDEGLSILASKGYPVILREQIEARYFSAGADGIFPCSIIISRNQDVTSYRVVGIPAGSAEIFLTWCVTAPEVTEPQ